METQLSSWQRDTGALHPDLCQPVLVCVSTSTALFYISSVVMLFLELVNLCNFSCIQMHQPSCIINIPAVDTKKGFFFSLFFPYFIFLLIYPDLLMFCTNLQNIILHFFLELGDVIRVMLGGAGVCQSSCLLAGNRSSQWELTSQPDVAHFDGYKSCCIVSSVDFSIIFGLFSSTFWCLADKQGRAPEPDQLQTSIILRLFIF